MNFYHYKLVELDFYLVVLDKVLWLAGNGGVGVHHILVHHCLGSEQGEASGAGGQRAQLKRKRLREFLDSIAVSLFMNMCE